MSEELKLLVCSVLGLDSNVNTFEESTVLLGDIPEFDSMAAVSLLTAIEDRFDIVLEDDEVSADIFQTFGTIYKFVSSKLDQK